MTYIYSVQDNLSLGRISKESFVEKAHSWVTYLSTTLCVPCENLFIGQIRPAVCGFIIKLNIRTNTDHNDGIRGLFINMVLILIEIPIVNAPLTYFG